MLFKNKKVEDKNKSKYEELNEVLDTDSLESIFPFSWIETKKHIETGESYSKTLCIVDYPTGEIKGAYLSPILKKGGNIELTTYFRPANIEYMIDHLNTSIKNKNTELIRVTDPTRRAQLKREINSSNQQLEKFLELDFEHPARKAYELGFKQSEERTRASILLSFVSDISSFIEEDIQEFTSESDFFLDEVGKEKTIVYVMLPVMSQEHSSLTALFFTQMFDQLYKLGDENHSKVPFPVDFILDEFPNLGILPNYEEFLATCRGYRISVTTIVQSLSQLNDKYGRDKAESILGNHATKICLGNVNTATAEYFQKEMGNTTVEFETSGSSSSSGKENKSTSSSKNVSYAGRSLMNIDEIMSMDRDTALLLTTGKHPIKMNKVKHFVLFPNLVDKFESKQNEYERKKDSNVKEYYQQLENEWKEKEEKKKARIQAEIEEEERQRAEQEKQKAEKTKKESDTEKVSNQVKNDDKDNQPKEDNTNKQQAFFDKLKNKNKQSS